MPPLKLFTPRFIKDIICIIIFSLFFYALTHNPITHPKITDSSRLYKIELMQYPLLLGLAGHNYLVMRDSHNNIIKELHGLATDITTKKWKLTGLDKRDTLKAWEFIDSGDFITKRTYSGIILFKGEEDVVKDMWHRTDLCKEKINQKNIPYPPLGFTLRKDTLNSNSVAYTLVMCMGLSTKHIGLITPGSTKNLLDNN